MADSFKDREQQAEAMFAHDEEVAFRVRAHRNRLFAAWVTQQMGASAPADYAESLRAFEFDHLPAAIVEKARQDLESHGVSLGEIAIHKALERFEAEAKLEVQSGSASV